jgi:hypothetical protein
MFELPADMLKLKYIHVKTIRVQGRKEGGWMDGMRYNASV